MVSATPQRSFRGQHALYSPPALRTFTRSQDPQPPLAVIEQRRFEMRRRVRMDGDEHLDSRFHLHPHFCLSNDDRKLARHEALNDIEDAAVGAARLTDMLFMGIAVKPEWDTSVLLEPSAIDVNIILTRQFYQNPRFMQVVEKIRRIVQEELAVEHITALHGKLDQITPRGYRFDPETHVLIENPVRLAGEQLPTPVGPEGSSHISSSSLPVPSVQRAASFDGDFIVTTIPGASSALQASDEMRTRRRRVTVVNVSDSESELEDPDSRTVFQRHHAPRRDDIPPSYEAEYYFRGDVESFTFSRLVKDFLNSLALSTHQCARIEAILDYHPVDWIAAFQNIGLEDTEARTLKEMVEAEIPAELVEIMQSAVGAGPLDGVEMAAELTESSSPPSSISSLSISDTSSMYYDTLEHL